MVHDPTSEIIWPGTGPGKQGSEAPNSIPWPPIIYVAATAAAVVLNQVWPLGDFPPRAYRAAGVAVMAAGFALDCSAMLTMRRQHANILPHRKATSLVTTGPFSLSRNPIYLGNTVMLLGAAAVFANAWFVAVTPFAAVAVTRLAIRREERHMGETFGAAWQDYVGRVPRWLRWKLRSGV